MKLVLLCLCLPLLTVGDEWGGLQNPLVPLGCFNPFLKSSDFQSSSTWNSPPKIGLATCVSCNAAYGFFMVRGTQCYCLKPSALENLTKIDDNYCDILCDPLLPEIKCGGNLGGSLYCDSTSSQCGTPFSTKQIYRNMSSNATLCLKLKCGHPGPKTENNYFEYFPRLEPSDCIIYCSLKKTSYAHLGWHVGENTTHGRIYSHLFSSFG